MLSKDFIQNNFPKGKLTLVCSRPSIGKTALAVSLAISMAEGNKKVVFFSLEMPKEQLCKRLERQFAKTGENFVIDDTPVAKLSYIRSRLETISADCVFIDYIQLMRGDNMEVSHEKEMSSIVCGLKDLARELDIPIIALAQMNRKGVSTGILPEDQVGTEVAILFRDENYQMKYESNKISYDFYLDSQTTAVSDRCRFLSSKDRVIETTLYKAFLDDKKIACRIFEILANDVLGVEQLEKIRLRYYDMHRNFFYYPKEEAERLGPEAGVWSFSKGLEPFRPKGWTRCYEDTTTVPVPITHQVFKDLTERTEKRGAIGLDLPTWFNLKDNERRIMIISQDPLRNNIWYSDTDKTPLGKTGYKEDYICNDALLSSPFGLHNRSWRDNRRGGGRMKLLVEQLIEYGYGVYLTDCRKYFVYDHEESDIYSSGKKDFYKSILKKEVDIIKPTCIVAMGNQAHGYCVELLGDDHRLKYVPHFSGAATWRAKKEFGIESRVTIEELAVIYAKKIINFSNDVTGAKDEL